MEVRTGTGKARSQQRDKWLIDVQAVFNFICYLRHEKLSRTEEKYNFKKFCHQKLFPKINAQFLGAMQRFMGSWVPKSYTLLAGNKS